jgi:hypothetical protein
MKKLILIALFLQFTFAGAVYEKYSVTPTANGKWQSATMQIIGNGNIISVNNTQGLTIKSGAKGVSVDNLTVTGTSTMNIIKASGAITGASYSGGAISGTTGAFSGDVGINTGGWGGLKLGLYNGIVMNTTDGADGYFNYLAGGGSPDSSRGGFVQVNGNEFGNGDITVAAGNNGGQIALQTNTTERMRIRADGNVGIGTTAPTTTLEVNGTISGSALQVNGSITGLSGTIVATHNVSYNVYVLPTWTDTARVYLVSAYTAVADVPALFNAMAMIMVNGTTARIMYGANGSSLVIGVDGYTITARQTNGDTQTITWKITQLND